MAFFHTDHAEFAAAAEIDARLRARLSLAEFFALAFSVAAVIIFVWVHALTGFLPYDYNIYIETARGNLTQYYYTDWLLPLFWAWAKLPYTLGYILWALLNIACIFFATRVFGGHTALTLLTFQAFCSLFLGQVTGFIIGCLALGWWGSVHHRWLLAGLGFWLAASKFQVGLSFGLLLWLITPITWQQRLRVLILPASLSILSLAFSPGWLPDLLARIREFPPYDWASISLWHWIGPLAILLWLPPLLLPLTRQKRFLALAAVISLTLPYYQQADLLALFMLPVGWLPVMLGNLGFLFFEYQFEALKFLWIAPLTVYLAVLLPAASTWTRSLLARFRSRV